MKSRFSHSRLPLSLCLIALFALISRPAKAHIGSPDIYAEANAGPYRLLVTIRPPTVVPGVAEIEVRSSTPGISRIDIAPMPLTGEGSTHAPVPDTMTQPTQDKQFFTGALWIMASGSGQIRFSVDGNQGKSVVSIPVAATASATRKMQPGLGAVLSLLGLLLVAGVIGIVGASVRDAQLVPGEAVPPARRQRAAISMVVATVFIIAALWFANDWWKAEAASYSRYVYKPLRMQAAFNGGGELTLQLRDPGWLKSRRLDDFVLDHNHLMHLYLLRVPGLDVVYHLHPEQIAPGEFTLDLPSIPAGDYRLYADVVHANGFPETVVGNLTLPKIDGRALSGDDAAGTAAPLSSSVAAAVSSTKFQLPDGYTMVWNRPPQVNAKQAQIFRFTLLDPNGQPPKDMALYMGMLGHAAFVKSDGTVFAHIHPSGTVSMTALMMAQAQNGPSASAPDSMASMSGMETTGSIPNQVGFPYGFPTPGVYRIFVQMKHGATIETAAFDVVVQ